MANGIPQEHLLRKPVNELEGRMLGVHRALHPERYDRYWTQQPQADWPYGWEGPGYHFQWDAGTIEWVAEELGVILSKIGLLAPGGSDDANDLHR